MHEASVSGERWRDEIGGRFQVVERESDLRVLITQGVYE